ncbi:YnfA family protein [Pseudoduganella sp. RAF53_2]|uniref:YnfA family protein n=1 Tax=unclassified Pseudoduganella TaxID=2637179 RepID=UPI003F9CB473
MLNVDLLKTIGLFFVTAIAELLGCYLPLLWFSGKGPAWLLLPAAASLAAFVWLLTLHPAASGRVYASYGAIYITAAIGWLWVVDGLRPSATDLIGAGLALAGAAVISAGARS